MPSTTSDDSFEIPQRRCVGATATCMLAMALWVGCSSVATNPSDTDGGVPPDTLPQTDAGSNTGTDAGTPTNSMSSLGTNLSPITDWSSELAFVDLFKTSRSWISGDAGGQWDDGRTLATDADGWVTSLLPNQVARTLMLVDLDGGYPSGRYTVLYDGEGTLEYRGGATLDNASSSPGRQVIEVAGAGGIQLNLTATNAGNPLRNLRILMPGGVCSDDGFRWCDGTTTCDAGGTCELFETNHEAQIFHPTFLASIKNYGVLRFMDWLDTNNSTQTNFSSRPLTTNARWTTHGVPLEIMVELSNRLGASPWFTLPHLATDDYVMQFARIVRDSLNSQLQVHIEYSNEVWNAIFAQNRHAQSEGERLGLAVGTDAYSPHRLFYSRRSVEIFRMWEQVYGNTTRLVRVMAWQVGSAYGAEQILDFENAAASTDAFAIAPYFGGSLGSPENAAATEARTVDQTVQYLRDVSLPETLTAIRMSHGAVQARGIPLVTYEAGQHLVGHSGIENNATINTLMDQVNRDPRMGELYSDLLNGWRDAGGQLMVHFNNCASYSKWGRWGALENLSVLSSPKFDALQQFIRDNPRWW